MRHLASAAFGVLIACTTMARAEEPAGDAAADGGDGSLVVVELFTSQGCVACPPADAYFAVLAGQPGVMPLALHVDYWDYIGWEDSFADPRFTERQIAYLKAIGSRSKFTPQFVIDGGKQIAGFKPKETEAALADAKARARAVRLVAARAGDEVRIEAEALSPLAAPLRVQLVRYLPEETVEIERGENAGKTVTYHNVVTSWDVLGDWSGAEKLEVSVPMTGDSPGVVVLQGIGPGPILAASQVR